MKLTGSRVYWVSTAVAVAFMLYGLFFYVSQQNLLKNITIAKLASARVHADEQAQAETARLRGHAASLSSTIAKITASQLENSQAFNVLKDGMASTLGPFMDYPEISAIEITDKDNRPYVSMWKSGGGIAFRVGYAIPPAFREKYRFVVRSPSVSGGQVQGYVAVYVDDQAISEQTTKMKDSLRTDAQTEIATLRDHFRRSLVTQLIVLLFGIVFAFFSSQAIARSYRIIDAHRRELRAFNLQLEHKVRERTDALQAAVCENQQINDELRASQKELLLSIDALRSKDEDLRHLAFHDTLTGLPNRALLIDRMEQSIAVAIRQTERRAIMFIDLDRFKSINDSLGHDAGDALLRKSAARLLSTLRATDTAARIGGDEFVVLLNDVDTPDSYASIAQNLIDVLSLPLEVMGRTVQVSASIGIACFPDDANTAVELMKHADLAMYEAKSAGGETYRFFEPAMTGALMQKLQLESELRHAIDHNELQLYYQPKISLDSNELSGVEALVRWRHPVRGIVSPMDFIPLAEATGLIVRLGDWVLEEACRQSAKWRARGLGRIKIAVNISARQMQQGDLVERICELTRQYGVPPSDLEVELTESVVMANLQESARIFTSLRQIGTVIAMDDFGTGYSSLANLRRLPIDVLKIDRSFVTNADRDGNDAEIIKTIIALAQTLKLAVVAEGVETEAQAAFLKGCGCTTAQGYLYSKPQPAARFERWLLQSASGAVSQVAASAQGCEPEPRSGLRAG
ncbi:EAL domain-containing protein [Trinickia sp. LjRoot230]|uniref:putative bifunctional diguanylate cyclase/phosphodiesterase n=1 Tax=Trinickia sp. LjRoot230 TaxID=3342288 RepID=UPI003ED14933